MRITQSMAHPQWWPAVQGHQLPNSLLQQEVGQKAEADIISPQEHKNIYNIAGGDKTWSAGDGLLTQ